MNGIGGAGHVLEVHIVECLVVMGVHSGHQVETHSSEHLEAWAVHSVVHMVQEAA